MEPLIEQLQNLRNQRHESAQRKYSELINRYDHPREGDAQTLDQVLTELHLDLRHLQSDVRVIEQYRAYLKGEPGTHGCKKDAEMIRKANRQLFIAVEET